MEQTKEHKERNKGGRPKKEATEKLKYRIAVKMTAADYFRLHDTIVFTEAICSEPDYILSVYELSWLPCRLPPSCVSPPYR